MSSHGEPDTEICHKERAAQPPPPLFQNGDVVIQIHHVGWIIAGCFTLVATATSIWLVNKHLQWYTNKREQRYIVRLLFMVPLYAIISLASYLWWNHATPLILVRDCYESTVLTAFFYLLLMYLSPDAEEQKRIFLKHGLSRMNDAERLKKGEDMQKWVFPFGFVKWKPSNGLYFLQLMKWGVLQYCVIRPVTTFAAVVLDYMGLYCESSWGLGWGHVYITIIVSLSVTIAMYCLIQLYVSVSKDLAKHQPLLKLFAIKAVVFLTFWQATFLSVLSMMGVVKDGKYMTAEDINIGIGALLETLEMMIFAFLHIRAFTYKVYQPFYDPESNDLPPERTRRLKSLGHAMDFRETFREIWAGCIYLWDKFRGKEPAPDIGAMRAAHYESAFGKSRSFQMGSGKTRRGNENQEIAKKPMLPKVEVEIDEDVDVDIAGERQWLGIGNDYGYGLKFLRQQRSEGLEQQIENELEKRGYTLRESNTVTRKLGQGGHTRPTSWWRSIYSRISQSGHEPDTVEVIAPDSTDCTRSTNRAQSRSRRISRDNEAEGRLLAHMDIDLNDQPPPSIIRKNRRERVKQSVDKWRQSVTPMVEREDVLMPLSTYAEHRRQSIYHDVPRVLALGNVHDPRQNSVLRSPPISEGPLTRIFPSVDEFSTEGGGFTEGGQSIISSPEGYKLAKPTPPARLVPSQPSIIPVDRLKVAGERHATIYQLADEQAHVSMTANVDDTTSFRSMMVGETSPGLVACQEQTPVLLNFGSSSPILSTQTHSRNPKSNPRATAGLRRSSAQYHPSKPLSSRRRTSLPPTTATLPLPLQLAIERESCELPVPIPQLTSFSPRPAVLPDNPPMMQSLPTFGEDFLCYSAHISPTYPDIRRLL